DFLVRHPEETRALIDLRAWSREELDDELAALASRLGPADGLRRSRRRAPWRLAARDLAGAPVEGVVAEISSIAEACLSLACRSVAPEGLAVVGLGKLGGAELNYASDVDVLFVSQRGGGGRETDGDDRGGGEAAGGVRLVPRA